MVAEPGWGSCTANLCEGEFEQVNLDAIEVSMTRGSLPGLGGVGVGATGAIPYSGLGHVGDAGHCYSQLARTLLRVGEVIDNVEEDSIDVEKHVKELAPYGWIQSRPPRNFLRRST